MCHPRRRGRLIASVAVAAVVLAACGGDNGGSSATTTAPPTSVAPTTAKPPTTVPTSGAATTPPTTAASTTAKPGTTAAPPTTVASDRCRTNELSAALGPQDAGAGNIYIPLILKNTGTRTCAVAGYPGVSLLDASGNQIGTPATRETGFPEAAVTLAPGAQASTALHTANEGIAPGSCLPPSTKVRVFPPNELDALEIAGKVTVCGNLFSVSPLVAGTTGR